MTGIEPGDVIQIDPAQGNFGACLAVVDEVNERRVMCAVIVPGNPGERCREAWIFLRHDQYERIGTAMWWHEESECSEGDAVGKDS